MRRQRGGGRVVGGGGGGGGRTGQDEASREKAEKGKEDEKGNGP